MAKFSDDELLQITVLAAGRIEVGLWRKLERQTGKGFDRIFIWMSRSSHAYYKLERDQSGWTYLLWCAPDSWRPQLKDPLIYYFDMLGERFAMVPVHRSLFRCPRFIA